MASTLAGKLTLLGSVADLIVLEVAGFLEYCRWAPAKPALGAERTILVDPV